jgi:hypothetical protein
MMIDSWLAAGLLWVAFSAAGVVVQAAKSDAL